MIKIKISKLNEKAIIPTYGTCNSAGADLYAMLDEPISILPSEMHLIHTGLSMEIPSGYVGLIFARSGAATKRGLAPANKVGVIDSDYRGEIMIPLFNHSKETQIIQPNERIAQISFVAYEVAEFDENGVQSATERGAGGFGSTGK